AKRMQAKVGTRIQVIVDEIDEEGAVARTMGDAPGIDGMVYLNDFFDCAPGDIIAVDIEHADEYDLWGSPIPSNVIARG
ncbi:MAG: 30S ribosomal protein S12 methylthiotransferase RimO, partial [Venatoribacter sp.]